MRNIIISPFSSSLPDTTISMSKPKRPAFTFILGDVAGKPRVDERARVRSHCMQGKNKRLDSRRSLRQARHLNDKIAKTRVQLETSGPNVDCSAVAKTKTPNEAACTDVDRRVASSSLLPRLCACPHDLKLMPNVGNLPDDSMDLLFRSMSPYRPSSATLY